MKRLLLTASLLIPISLPAQQVGSNSASGQEKTYTLNVNSQLVVENVVIKDKQGNFLTGLKPSDFEVTEDGAPQTIRLFEYQHLSEATDPLPPPDPNDENITIYKRLTRTQFAAEGSSTNPSATSESRYKNHRLLAFYFDMTAMKPEDQIRALGAAQKFVRTQITPADLVAILRYSGGSVDVLQDFTADRNRLLSILQTLVVGEGQGNADSIDDAASADTGAAFGQDDSEFNIFNTDRQLSALQTAAKMLGQLNEKKSLIYFASGLRLNGINNQAQLHATIDAAIRAGVSFWAVDARGLVASAPLGDASQGSPGNQGVYSGTAVQAVTDTFTQSQDTMYSLAADTGGKALFDNNDLTRGIVQAQHAISDYYVLGYYTTNTAQNGRFRRVKITLKNGDQATLDYRQGYYANKEFNRFTSVDKERQLEDALMLGDPVTDLTIAMEINYFQLNRAEYYIPFEVKIPGRELALAKRSGAEHTLIDFVCEVKDDTGGMTVSNVRDDVNIKLSDSTAAELASRPIEYDGGFTLSPGKYTLKFLARDDETGRIGTYQTTFTIPNLNKETKHVPISSVVLSTQRVDPKDALYSTTHGKDEAKNEAANPLFENGKKLIPSVTRVFRQDHDLYIYLQAYEGAPPAPSTTLTSATPATPNPPPAPRPLIAFVTLYHDHQKTFETTPIAATPTPGVNRLGRTPIHFEIPLHDLPSGDYTCVVSILDPTNQKVSFWQAPFLLVK